MQIDYLDHLVLTVADVEATCAFYERVLGVEIVSFTEGRKALTIGPQKGRGNTLGKMLFLAQC